MKNFESIWKKHFFVFICSFIAILLTLHTVQYFIVQVKENKTSITGNNLRVTSGNCVQQVEMTFDSYFMILETATALIQNQITASNGTLLEQLDTVAKQNECERISIDYLDGSSKSSDGHDINIKNLPFFKFVQNGTLYISDVIEDPISKIASVHIGVPLQNEDHGLVGGLRLTVTTEQLNRAINMVLFDSEGYYHIIDENGTYVAVTPSQNALLMEESFLSAIQNFPMTTDFQRRIF